MRTHNSGERPPAAAGFTLPAVLVVVAALLILAVGALLVAGLERGSARSFVDRQRAGLAAAAALEDLRAILAREAANDDFIIMRSAAAEPPVSGREPAPALFLSRGTADGTGYVFRHVPLFSAAVMPATGSGFSPPPVGPLLGAAGGQRFDFTALPYHDKVSVSWRPVRDGAGRTVARYAYWVEDMQAKIDPRNAGNDRGTDGAHLRLPYPFPAPGAGDPSSVAGQPPLDQIALFAIDPAATGAQPGDLGKTLVRNRGMLVSPDSVLAAAGTGPPLTRLNAATDDGKPGQLAEPRARAIERSLISGIQAYDEQPLVPFRPGIDPAAAGKPKLNLNRLVATGGAAAVDEMAAFIRSAYPGFEQRKGGFPDDYVKTLAACAIDYADGDGRPTLAEGSYRGIDSYPLTTELALKVRYEGKTVENGRQYLNFNIRLFAELYNHSNLEVSGNARLTYEVALRLDSIGTGTGSPPFDSPGLLGDPAASTHDLEKIGGRFWTRAVAVRLLPGQYQCHAFAEAAYRMDMGTVSGNPVSDLTPFSLLEDKGESGCSLMWNNEVVERQQGVVRQQGFIYGLSASGKKTGGYLAGTSDILTKAHLPALLYQKTASSAFYGNCGDPRISHYLNRSRNSPLDENAYPANSSPNRRSVRLSLYKADVPEKTKVYARTLPSEWPDGGHDAAVGAWTPGTSDATELTDPKFDFPHEPAAGYSAIQRISNRGYFISATELGHVFDPIMYAPTFVNPADTASFRSKSKMPAGESSWPDARSGQGSPLYGGGNTLRIGRPEHPAFNVDGETGTRASGLLDLFHTGRPSAASAEERTGPTVRIHGHVNINTASRDALRALAAGTLVMDPALAARTGGAHAAAPRMAPATGPLELGAPQTGILADEVADAIIAGRPYASPAGLARARDSQGREVFGNRELYAEGKDIEWTDAAAEEVFGRVYQAATVRSRNFRVWIVAQAVGPSAAPEVRAEVRKVYTLMADPGERGPDGAQIDGNFKMRILSANEF